MTVVIGTAGHIDHGKTTLLRALTGIDADRLPEEQRRGMTIDVGYAWLDRDDGSSIDFVDVPGHEALVGNMLVGAGEIDAVMLVVAADDGPRAQTIEHLELIDGLGIRDGLVVVTKVDLAGPERTATVRAEVARLVTATSLAGVPILEASGSTGAGVPELRMAVDVLVQAVLARRATAPVGPVRLAIDRAFSVRGHGTVVTGSLRGGTIRPGDALRLEPGGRPLRVRGIQVHHGPVAEAAGGRVALNLTGTDLDTLARGAVVTSGSGIVSSDRLLVRLEAPARLGAGSLLARRPAWPPADGTRTRLHLGTAQAEAVVGRRGREAVALEGGALTAMLRLDGPIATFAGDRAVLRRPSPGDILARVVVLDPRPAAGAARRRANAERIEALSAAIDRGDAPAAAGATIALHGAMTRAELEDVEASLGVGGPSETASGPGSRSDGALVLAPDLARDLADLAIESVAAFHAAQPEATGMPSIALRQVIRAALRRATGRPRAQDALLDASAAEVVEALVGRRILVREGDRVRAAERAAGPPPALAAAMDRLAALLEVPAPPDLSEAARAAHCPPEGVQRLQAEGRIVRVEADLAWGVAAFAALERTALDLAERGPLAPAALRDATGTTRRVVMPLLEDLNRRGLLVRTPAGHVLGPRARRPVS